MKQRIPAPVIRLLTVIAIGTLLGCSPMTVKRDDPLIGKIFASADQSEISYAALLDRATRVGVIYLGENHENADHHRIQLELIRDLIAKGKQPQIGFEFFSVEQTSYLMGYTTGRFPGGHGVSEKNLEVRLRHDLGWQNREDRSWQFYFEFLKLARDRHLTVFGADLAAGTVNRIARTGIDGLTPVEKALLRPTGFDSPPYKELMFEKFKAAHCGFARESHQERMYQTWLARNDTMARSIVAMADASPDQPVVVILGGGHTEHNMGVFERVQHLRPDIRQLNLGLTEIFRESAPLDEYLSTTTIGGQTFLPAYEYLWFTQRFSYEDPCLRFKEQLKRIHDS